MRSVGGESKEKPSSAPGAAAAIMEAKNTRKKKTQTTLDSFANFARHTEKLSKLGSCSGKPNIRDSSSRHPPAPKSLVAEWGSLVEEVEAEEEWDDNHPLKFWVPGTKSLAPWLGTPGEWIMGILEHAEICTGDVVCDVGCGDGRFNIIAQQQYGVKKSIGIELDGELVEMCVKHAQRRIGENYEEHGVKFIHGDALQQDLSDVTLLICYLLPDSFPILEPLFRDFLSSQAKNTESPKRRLVVIGWKPPMLTPVKTVEFGAQETATSSQVFYYDKNSLQASVEVGYWNTRAIGEPLRLLLHYLQIPFKDTRYQVGPPPTYDKGCWTNSKERLGLSFPNLPYFVDKRPEKSIKLTQLHAILWYLGETHDKQSLLGTCPSERAQVHMIVEFAKDWINELFDVTYCNAPWLDNIEDGVHRGEDQCEKTSPKFELKKIKYLSKKLPKYLELLGSCLTQSQKLKNVSVKWIAGTPSPTVADFVVAEYLDQHRVFQPDIFSSTEGIQKEKLAALEEYCERFFSLPAIASYRSSLNFKSEPLHNRYSHFHTGWVD